MTGLAKSETFKEGCPACGMEQISICVFIGRDKIWHAGSIACKSCGFEVDPSTCKGGERNRVIADSKIFKPAIGFDCTWKNAGLRYNGTIVSYLPRRTSIESHAEKYHANLVKTHRDGGRLIKLYDIKGDSNSKFPRYVIETKDGHIAIPTRRITVLR